MIRIVFSLCLVVSMVAFSPVRAADAPGDPVELMEKVLKKYRSFETFQQKAVAEFDLESSESAEDQSSKQESTLIFKSPGRFVEESEQSILVANKDRIWLYSAPFNQYIEADAPADGNLEDLLKDLAFPGLPDPVTETLYRPGAALKDITSAVTRWDKVTTYRTNGTSSAVVSGQMKSVSLPIDDPMPFDVTVRLDTLLVQGFSIDATEAYRSMMKEMKLEEDEEKSDVKKATMRVTYKEIKINQAVDDKVFAFTPPEDARKVKTFFLPSSERTDQLKLIGKPAPGFEGKDLDGKPLSLADFKGKVVLLDFWATWCGPCVKAIPHIQDLAEAYKDKDVVVIGVNRDGVGTVQKVRRFIEKKNITFRQFMDTEDQASGGYFVNAIPCSVLIDKKGVVQQIKTGFSPNDEENLKEAINTLLKGGQLFDAEAIEQEMAMAEQDIEDDEEKVASTNTVIASVAEDRILPGNHENAPFDRYNMREFDLDGDGRNEWLSAGWSGDLYILSSDGATVEKKKFYHRQSRSIRDFVPIKKQDGMHWLIAYQKHGHTGLDTSVHLDYYNAENQQLWTYNPDLGKGMSEDVAIDVADLDGDGKEECILALTTSKMKKMDGSSWRSTGEKLYLGILDMEGHVLSLKRIGKRCSFLRAIPAGKTQKGTILITVDNKLRRYHYGLPGK